MISNAFDTSFGRNTLTKEKTNKMMTHSIESTFVTLQPKQTPKTSSVVYESIEDYTAKTGKRFRMTKDQKARNISREEAFKEFNKGN